MRSPPSPLFTVPNVTVHPSTASVPVTVLLYNGPLLCSFNVLSNDYYYLAIQRSVAFGVILSLLFFFCTVEDILTQDGAIGVKFWLRVEQTPETGTR